MIKKLLLVLLIYTLFYMFSLYWTGYVTKKENEWTLKQTQLSNKNYTHDWYLIGSSRTRRGLDPKLIAIAYNEAVYNLSCSSFFMPANWLQLETFLKQVSHKKIILELSYNISSLDYYPSFESKGHYIRGYLTSFLTSKDYSSQYPLDLVKNFTQTPFRIINFLPGDVQKQNFQKEFDEWGQSTNPIFNLPHSPTQPTYLEARSKELKKYFNQLAMKKEVNDFYLRSVLNLVRVAQQSQNQIYFYIPTTLSETEARMLASVWHYLPEENKLYTYKDPQFDKLFTKDYLFDEGHLNKKGSQLLTQIVIRQLQSMKVIGEPTPQYVSTSGSTHSGSGTPVASTSTLTE